MGALIKYETARHALSEALRVDEVKDIRDRAEALRAYARQAQDRQLETDALELRERATRRLGRLLIEAKEEGQLRRGRNWSDGDDNGSDAEPLSRVLLDKMGIDKKLSMIAQRRAAVPEAAFEEALATMRAKVEEGVAPSDALRAIDRESQREAAQGKARELSEASALSPEGRKFAVIYADPPWRRRAGFTDRAYENHYPTMSWADIMAMPVAARALDDAWLFLWIPRAHLLAPVEVAVETDRGPVTILLPLASAVARAWGFAQYSTAFVWTKTDDAHPNARGMGLICRDQDELLLLFKRGKGRPAPKAEAKPGSNHRELPREHSRKPDYYRDMIATMTGGQAVLELFARVDPEHPLPAGWEGWGNQAGMPEASTEGDGDGAGHDPLTGELLEGDDAMAPPAVDGDLYQDAVRLVREAGKVSPSLIQRRLSIPYSRARALVERMEEEGICGPADVTGRRELRMAAEAAE